MRVKCGCVASVMRCLSRSFVQVLRPAPQRCGCLRSRQS
ncbi:hypothetical protein XCR_2174 [Xanthomonas campestris pv. raphani 756C]|nr:hypothetical protein XCR_2174 [Xanthomonas campestris pv. raphani 756C]